MSSSAEPKKQIMPNQASAPERAGPPLHEIAGNHAHIKADDHKAATANVINDVKLPQGVKVSVQSTGGPAGQFAGGLRTHAQLTQARILIVEDEMVNRTLLRGHLKREGFDNLVEAENGEEALKIMHQKEIDLVLSDIQMPKVDGIELLKRMKADMRLAGIPVIVVSGLDETNMIAQSIEMGAEDHLAKPCEPIVLRARVFASLEKKRLRDREKTYLTEIKTEKKRADALINVIFPSAVANELKINGKVQPRRHDNVAILFCDIVGFTSYCERHSPEEVVSNLQNLFELFEEVIVKNRMEKIKTIGDEFMATAGLTVSDPYPLHSAIRCGLEMIEATVESGIGWDVRIGVNAGPVVAGVVGKQKYLYDVWGDTVNIASRMTGQATPGTVAIMQKFWTDVQDDFEARTVGIRDVKGVGPVEVIECYGVL